MRCECCTTKDGIACRDPNTGYIAYVCADCKASKHTYTPCLLCDATWLWTCAYLAHFSREHPRMLEQVQHDPFDDVLHPQVDQKSVGTLWVSR